MPAKSLLHSVDTSACNAVTVLLLKPCLLIRAGQKFMPALGLSLELHDLCHNLMEECSDA